MQIVIDIPDRIQYGIENGITVNGSEASQIVLDAVKNGTILPKRHEALKDAGMIKRFLYSSAKFWGTWNLGKHRIFEAIDNVETIIEANREVDE